MEGKVFKYVEVMKLNEVLKFEECMVLKTDKKETRGEETKMKRNSMKQLVP